MKLSDERRSFLALSVLLLSLVFLIPTPLVSAKSPRGAVKASGHARSAPRAAQATTSASPGPAVLLQALNTVGGAAAISTIQDFTATGSITYYWAGDQVQGSAIVRGRGIDEFRLDASLSAGTRSYAVGHGTGALKDTDGTVTAIPYHNTVNLGIPTFPFPTILARLSDPSAVVTDMGLVTTDTGTQLHQIRVQRQLSSQVDPDGALSKLCATDYFVDPQSGVLVKAIDTTHPVETMTRSYAHEVDFAKYATFNGIGVPTLVTEKVGGQTIWQLQISSVSFNSGLTDATFGLQ